MKLNKAFTLAEILIVLMVIGALAALTLPNLMKGVTAAQNKAAYQKAYAAISNIAAVEKVGGQLPSSAKTAQGMSDFFNALNSNLSVKEYASSDTYPISSSGTLTADNTKTKVQYGGFTYGEGSEELANTTPTVGTFSPWIITDDGIAYTLTAISGASCSSKTVINDAKSTADTLTKTCLLIVVDVNGLNKTPNKLETQIGELKAENKMVTFDGDRFYIFLGSDGVAAGPKKYTVSGRIMADLK